jgi:hypothetical protein
MARRKHRKVAGAPPGWKGCKCPKGSRKVTTCTTTPGGKKLCRGRGWGCLGVGPSQLGKPSPRFIAALCSSGTPPAGGREPPKLPPPRKPPSARKRDSLPPPNPPAHVVSHREPKGRTKK